MLRAENAWKKSESHNGADVHSKDANETGTTSWKFLSKQHWPELLSFYHIRFNERYVLGNLMLCVYLCALSKLFSLLLFLYLKHFIAE